MSQAYFNDALLRWIQETINMGFAMAPWLLFGFGISGLLHSYMPVDWVRRHLAKDGFGAVVKAALVGTPLPICSCGVIPVARWLRKEGASRGSTMSFLVSTPETGVDSILATMAMMGGLFAGVRPVVAIISGIVVGMLVSKFAGALVAEKPVSTCKDGCCNDSPAGEMPSTLKVRAVGFWPRLREAVHYGFVELVSDVSKWLLIGLVAGGAISAFVPQDFMSSSGAWGVAGSYFAVILIGIPLYVCATGSIPIAAALVAKGISPGAALVFLIVGPATNVATIAFVGGTFGRRALGIYLGSIVGVAMTAGILLDWLVPQLVIPHANHFHGGDSWAWWEIMFGLVLFALLLPSVKKEVQSLFKKRKSKEKKMPDYQATIPSISCGNCVRHVEKAARSIPGVTGVRVDVSSKHVEIDGKFDKQALEAKLTEEGYPPVHQ